MRLQRLALGMLFAATMLSPVMAQVVSPLGGSTTNPQSPPPATAHPTPVAPVRPATVTPPAGTAVAPAGTVVAPTTGASTTAPARTHARRTLTERFEAANTTHDGKLTLEQAKAGRLVAVARDFDKIDKDKHGYVTLDQIKSFQTAQRAERRAARTSKPQ